MMHGIYELAICGLARVCGGAAIYGILKAKQCSCDVKIESPSPPELAICMGLKLRPLHIVKSGREMILKHESK